MLPPSEDSGVLVPVPVGEYTPGGSLRGWLQWVECGPSAISGAAFPSVESARRKRLNDCLRLWCALK